MFPVCRGCEHIIDLCAIIALIQFACANPLQEQDESTTNKPHCSMFREYGKNDLSINDIVVKSADSDVVCIKAIFSLAIKVEEPIGGMNGNLEPSNDTIPPSMTDDLRIVLGYLPLDSVTSVIDNCPKPKNKNASNQNSSTTTSSPEIEADDGDELEMIITFECGKLAFTFRRDENYYVSSINGVVNLDSTTAVPYMSDKPVFFTSDLDHHFKFNDLVEIGSSAKTKAFILTANFYHTELEVFRTTASRDFIKPPDDKSKPFQDEDQNETAPAEKQLAKKS